MRRIEMVAARFEKVANNFPVFAAYAPRSDFPRSRRFFFARREGAPFALARTASIRS